MVGSGDAGRVSFANGDAVAVFFALHGDENPALTPAHLLKIVREREKKEKENTTLLDIILALVPRSDPSSSMTCPLVVSCRGLFLPVADVATFK